MLKIIKIPRGESGIISNGILAFCISIGVSALIFVAASLLDRADPFTLSVIYLTISVVPALNHHLKRKPKHKERDISEVPESKLRTTLNIWDLALMTWIIAFFIFAITLIYPQMAFVPGQDIVRHYSTANDLLNTPELFSSSYPWFHYVLASIITMADPSMVSFQWGMAYVSITVIIGFYLMAKKYLGPVAEAGPVISTLFFFLFSGFGWFYYINETAFNTASSYSNLLASTFGASYWDVGVGQSSWIWFWFRPLTLGFTIAFALFYIMRTQTLSSLRVITISSIMTATLAQIHFPELFVFVLMVFVLSIFLPKQKLHQREIAVASILGILLSTGSNILSQNFLNLGNVPSLSWEHILLILLASLSIVFNSFYRRPTLNKIKIPYINARTVVLALVIIYAVITIHWLVNASPTLTADALSIYAVPWEFYPVLLGVSGLMAIICIVMIWERFRGESIMLFVLLFITTILLGRILTFINGHIQEMDYWERRLMPWLQVASAIILPVVVIEIVKKLRSSHEMLTSRAKSDLYVSLFFSGLILIGAFSTVLSIEFRVHVDQLLTISNDENKFVDKLKEMNPHSTILTFSQRSSHLAEYAKAANEKSGYVIGYYKDQMWPSKSPELPLTILASGNGSSVIFVGSQEEAEFVSKFQNGFIQSAILGVSKNADNKSFSNTLELNKLSPPVPSSNTVLILPDLLATNDYTASLFLSGGNYNYTTAKASDLAAIMNASTIITLDERTALDIANIKDDYELNFDELIVLNANEDRYLLSPFILRTIKINDWVPRGFGSGSISSPVLEETRDLSTQKKVINMSVQDGPFKYWDLTKRYRQDIDLSNFDYLTFHWFGQGDGGWYNIRFYTTDESFFLYQLQDTWRGWKQIVLPMQIDPGREYESNVKFNRWNVENATWSDIKRIKIGTEASNSDNQGFFRFGNFGFGKYAHSNTISALTSKINLPIALDVPMVSREKEFRTIAEYGPGVPFLLHKQYANFEMFYFNILPLLIDTNYKDLSFQNLEPLYSNVMNLARPNITKYHFDLIEPSDLVAGGVMAFKEALMSGNLSISSPTIIADTSGEAIMNIGEEIQLFKNTSRIVVSDSDAVLMPETNATISNGMGFYTSIATEGRQELNVDTNHDTILSLIFNNGTSNRLDIHPNGTRLSLNLFQPNITARQPGIELDGHTAFHELYAYGHLAKSIRSLGSDIDIQGRVSFDVLAGDAFNVVNHTKIEGSISRHDPIYRYDELGNFLNMFSFAEIRNTVLVISLVLIFKYFVIDRKKR